MRPFVYDALPGRVVFGPGEFAGAEDEIDRLGAGRVLLIADRSGSTWADRLAECSWTAARRPHRRRPSTCPGRVRRSGEDAGARGTRGRDRDPRGWICDRSGQGRRDRHADPDPGHPDDIRRFGDDARSGDSRGSAQGDRARSERQAEDRHLRPASHAQPPAGHRRSVGDECDRALRRGRLCRWREPGHHAAGARRCSHPVDEPAGSHLRTGGHRTPDRRPSPGRISRARRSVRPGAGSTTRSATCWVAPTTCPTPRRMRSCCRIRWRS